MAKSRDSKNTINRILDTSLKLFFEKGYEHTTIQDIIDTLGDLSKGAIYHHFKSKEDILAAASDKLFGTRGDDMKIIRDQPNKTGLEKLKDMITVSLDDPNQSEFFSFSPNLLNIPDMFVESLKETFEKVVPEYITPLVEEGVKDGSIKTDYPKELSELIILFSNYWFNPLVFPMTNEQLKNKIEFTKQLLIGTGADILLDGILGGLESYRKAAESNK